MTAFIKMVETALAETLPPEAQVTKAELEGPEIVIYTKNIEMFLSNETWVKKLASRLKKRVVIRADSSLLLEPEEAKNRITSIIPQEAGIEEINFDPNFNQVQISAYKLGLVVGKGGQTLKQIAIETGWMPKLLRIPTSKSDIVKGIRQMLLKESSERKKFLLKLGKNIYRDKTRETEWIKLNCFGGCKEVGRSCFLIETPESKVLLDCGISLSEKNGYPYLSTISFPLSELDAVVTTHAHLDHSGFVPYLYAYGYEGPVYCTPPTRDLSALLCLDYIRVALKEGKEPPYKDHHVTETVKHTVTREYGEVTDITPDVRLTLHNAGHILGSASVHLHIGEGMHNIVYSGDIKSGFSQLFDPAATYYPRVETLIMECTYGNPRDVQPPRYIAEKQLLAIINETTTKGGSVLIPVFAIGRGQEIMLVLENYARNSKFAIPVYVDGMTREASAIHSAYPEYLKRSVQRRILHNDSPFDSEIFIEADRTAREEVLRSPSVILAPAGMMNGGPVLEYFKMMAEDPKHTIIFVGYQGAGTLGNKIQKGMRRVTLEENGKTRAVDVKMRVETVDGFSGHSDRNQLLNYIKRIKSKVRLERIIAVHGDENKVSNFARSVSQIYKVEAIAPRNLDSIRLE